MVIGSAPLGSLNTQTESIIGIGDMILDNPAENWVNWEISQHPNISMI